VPPNEQVAIQVNRDRLACSLGLGRSGQPRSNAELCAGIRAVIDQAFEKGVGRDG
jgi:hypothetical protein